MTLKYDDMNQELLEILKTHYEDGIHARNEDSIQAEAARKRNDWLLFFDMSLYFQLADVCWLLEKWGDAKQLYRHNSKILVQRREWLVGNKPKDYPEDALLDLEASTHIKAGELRTGSTYLRKAIEYWNQKKGNQLVLTTLGMHAAQIGETNLIESVRNISVARDQLIANPLAVPSEIRNNIHYELVEVQLLTGNWNNFYHALSVFEEAVQALVRSSMVIYNQNLQNALVAVCNGFKALENIKNKSGDVNVNSARNHFEKAMLLFFKSSQQIDSDMYFMRLNCLIADQFAQGKAFNPNPFADLEEL